MTPGSHSAFCHLGEKGMNDFKFDNHFAQVWRAMGQAAKETVDETVDAIGDEAEANAPKQSGALAATVVRLHAGENGTADENRAESEASKLSPGMRFNSRLALPDRTAQGHTVGAVEVLADYGPLIHNGGGGLAPRPFLEDAGQAQENEMEARAREKFARKLDG